MSAQKLLFIALLFGKLFHLFPADKGNFNLLTYYLK